MVIGLNNKPQVHEGRGHAYIFFCIGDNKNPDS